MYRVHFLLLMTLLASGEGATLRVNPSHPRIGVNGTDNFTITCSLEGRESSSGDIKESDVVEAVHRLRILKSVGSKWTPVVEFDSDWDSPKKADVVVGAVHHTTDVEGNVNSIKVRWDHASKGVGGEYMCELLGDSAMGQGMLMRTPRLLVDVEIPLTLHDLFELMKSSNAKLDTALADIQTNKADIQKAIEWQQKFNEEEEERNKIIWPQGDYALLQPEAGCPEPNGWETGFIKHHTESGRSTTENRLSDPAHMKKPIMERDGGDFFMTHHFCTTSRSNVTTQWPQGTYCIMRSLRNDCPPGFKEGFVRWDDEDDDNKRVTSGIIPWDTSGFPLIKFCCRDDQVPNHPIALPVAQPFYLHQYKEICQEVQGMSVTEEFMYFDTETDRPSSKQTMPNPSSPEDLPNVKINLCYYVKI